MITPVYITDVIGQVVASTEAVILSTIIDNETAVQGSASPIQQLNYQFGHYNELIETLIQYDASQEERYNKYPLIWLRTDFRERRGQMIGIYAEVYLNIVICHATEQTFKATERMAKVFKPVLYPIYYELLNQLYFHGLSFAYDGELIPHDKYDRHYWGTSKVGKTTDYVDAIEIDNLVLKINYSNCYNTEEVV